VDGDYLRVYKDSPIIRVLWLIKWQ